MAKFGAINLQPFVALEDMPQKAQSAWTGAFESPEDPAHKLIGAEFKPLMYCGDQPVHGTNHYFIAERTIPYSTPIRNLVRLTIYECDGKYEFLDKSILVIL